MQKSLLMIPLMLLAVSTVLAIGTYSIRGDINLANINNFFNKGLTYVDGSYNANINLERSMVTGQGYVIIQARNLQQQRERLSINWDSKGNNYGFQVLENTALKTVILAKTRVIYNGDIFYGVPMKITYEKNTNKFMVESQSGNFPVKISA